MHLLAGQYFQTFGRWLLNKRLVGLELAPASLLYKSASQQESTMKRRIMVLTLALCCIAIGECFAQGPFMGTWKLNEAKSKFAPGAARNNTVLYEPAGDKVKVTIDGADAAGNPTHNEWVGKFDGQDYPVTGDPNSDTRSYDGRSAHKTGFTMKKDKKVTTTGLIVLSADGKSRTVTLTGTDAQGKKVKSTAVYDKQ
jgi:hypothetical protein